MAGTVKCEYCGEEILADAELCEYCGEQVEKSIYPNLEETTCDKQSVMPSPIPILSYHIDENYEKIAKTKSADELVSILDTYQDYQVTFVQEVMYELINKHGYSKEEIIKLLTSAKLRPKIEQTGKNKKRIIVERVIFILGIIALTCMSPFSSFFTFVVIPMLLVWKGMKYLKPSLKNSEFIKNVLSQPVIRKICFLFDVKHGVFNIVNQVICRRIARNKRN